MDWQQAVSLCIVGITGTLFLWNWLRPRKHALAQTGHCGCSAAHAGAKKQSIVIQGRRGERPTVTVKL